MPLPSDDFDDFYEPESEDDVCPHGFGFDEYCEECDELLEDEL